MILLNPYQFRFALKFALVAVTFIFFISHSLNLSIYRLIYIRRFVQYGVQSVADEEWPPPAGAPSDNITIPHHVADHKSVPPLGGHLFSKGDEEAADVFNLNGTIFSRENESEAGFQPPMISSGGDEDEDSNFDSSGGDDEVHGILPPFHKLDPKLQDKIGLYGSIATALYIVFESCFLFVYIVIIIRRRFWSLTMLTSLNLFMLINYYIENGKLELKDKPWELATHWGGAENPDTKKWITFEEHVDSLGREATTKHMLMASTLEIILATIETILLSLYTLIVRFYPEPYQGGRRQLVPQRDLDGGGGTISNGNHQPLQDDGESLEMLPLDRNRHTSGNSSDSAAAMVPAGENDQEAALCPANQLAPKVDNAQQQQEQVIHIEPHNSSLEQKVAPDTVESTSSAINLRNIVLAATSIGHHRSNAVGATTLERRSSPPVHDGVVIKVF